MAGMKRRTFSTMIGGAAMAAVAGKGMAKSEGAAKPFKMLFAPHPNQIPTGPKKDYLGQLQLAHDLGFRAWEDNKMSRQTPVMQEKIGQFCKDKGITLGVQVISGGGGMPWCKPTDEGTKRVLADMKAGIEVAKRTGQTWMTLIPGTRIEGVPLDEQIKKSVDLMKRCCDIVEDSGIIMVLEPLSHGVKGGEPLLRSFEDGFKLCELVNRKSCKLLADFYHEGTIGNDLIPEAKKTWGQVAYVQYGDVPGRKEPGTGKLNYKEVTKWIHDQDFKGVIGMEHGASAKGEEGTKKLVAAYRKIDV